MTTARDPLEVLQKSFGLTSFRPHQEDAIRAVLAGRDVLATMPTGAGKSLIYQLPALCLDGLVLVISPLIALMKDQVDALQKRGVRAAYVNSSVSSKQRAARLQAAVDGKLDLLFITPERFRSKAFQELEKHLPVARLAVDEAHCISQWGHDFRPDYSRLGLYKKRLGNPPTIALTATATERVARDITSALDLDNPHIVRTGIERPNLYLGFERIFLAEEKIPHLAKRIRALPGPGIVYSTLIRDLEDLHDELARMGIPSLVYHGKLSPQERRSMQERFMASDESNPAIVLATNAFGMGVDKADIRFVLHAQVPRTIEAWTQEVGRAGRDGKPSFCETLFFPEDLAVQQEFVRWANPDREFVLSVWSILESWGERVATKDQGDLVAELLVKNRRDNRAGISLRWLEVVGAIHGSFERHDLRVNPAFMPSDLPAFVGSAEKLDGDLKGLLKLATLASNDEPCIRTSLAAHFDLDATEQPCCACNACITAEAWLAENLPAHSPQESPAPTASPAVNPVVGTEQGTKITPSRDSSSGTQPLQRGDWIQVGQHGLARILKVEGTPPRTRITIEDATSLKRRTLDPSRVRIRRIEG
ncbi:MAG: ATP-dependent DNA helicase RecQ [Gammaproteobacteria bacterium]|jgi:ATP-dependent DNA helicase RecQ